MSPIRSELERLASAQIIYNNNSSLKHFLSIFDSVDTQIILQQDNSTPQPQSQGHIDRSFYNFNSIKYHFNFSLMDTLTDHWLIGKNARIYEKRKQFSPFYANV